MKTKKFKKQPFFFPYLFFCLILSFLSIDTLAVNKVAKVIVLKGDVFVSQSGRFQKLKKGTWVLEGSTIKTRKRSFVKFLFIDKSHLSLGPQSQAKIQSFPKDKAGIIDLLKGEARAQVIKNHLEKNQEKSKFFVHTKTAAMGVRGTDFKVIYNSTNKATTLIVFEGVVKITKMSESLQRSQNNQSLLDRELNKNKAVSVRTGEYSGTDSRSQKIKPPVKISPFQLEAIKKSNSWIQSPSKKKKKRVRSLIPPGISPKKVITGTQTIEKEIIGTFGKEKGGAIIKAAKKNIEEKKNIPSPKKLTEKDLRPGGFVDLQTGSYFPPPKEKEEIDKKPDISFPEEKLGTFDDKTGSYIPPKPERQISNEKSFNQGKDFPENFHREKEEHKREKTDPISIHKPEEKPLPHEKPEDQQTYKPDPITKPEDQQTYKPDPVSKPEDQRTNEPHSPRKPEDQ